MHARQGTPFQTAVQLAVSKLFQHSPFPLGAGNFSLPINVAHFLVNWKTVMFIISDNNYIRLK